MDAPLDDVFIDEISFPATDGYALAGTLFLPRGAKRHAVLINSATAVPRKIYRGFASYLAHRGCAVLTYDYRGIGGSRRPAIVGYNRPKSLVGFKASMADWAAQDVTAAVRWMRERYGTLPLAYVGHSYGGQALGLIENNSEISRAAFIASQALASDDVAGKISRLRLHEPHWRSAHARAWLRTGLGRHRRGPAQRRVPAMGGLGLEPALSVRFKTAGAGEFCKVQGRAARPLLLRRSLGDAAGSRAADIRLHRDQARGARRQAIRRRRQGDRPFRLLSSRAPGHAVARRRGMDPGGVTVRQRRQAI
ncbi:alpha/beta fold hydrolase [Bradyrhizobium sp. CCBAU 51627]|uniref:alpha/beta fold hydrolase n=1 Tax=Bradyrhizobium sp. CCBAU 51627 TaxID=1325088 RepID=UPI003FA40CD5